MNRNQNESNFNNMNGASKHPRPIHNQFWHSSSPHGGEDRGEGVQELGIELLSSGGERIEERGQKEIKVKCPAKINLTLEILNKREDGFHNIQSVMQTIDLFDILTIKVEPSEKFEIKLSGTSDEIPYDERNLVHKAIVLFFANAFPRPTLSPQGRGSSANNFCSNYQVSVHIEKNIPISAGLAGGSTDAAGVLWGINQLFDNILSEKELHNLCAKLGSDLNFCLEGGCQLTTGRGEILEKLTFREFNLSLIKPKNIGISAKEAYTKFSEMENKPNLNVTEKWKLGSLEAEKLSNAKPSNFQTSKPLKNPSPLPIHNDLEFAVINDYKELQEIKQAYPNSIMSGSGSTFFVLEENFKPLSDKYWVKTDLKSISYGVCE